MTKVEASNTELAEAVRNALPVIDKILGADGRDLPSRPMAATTLFVEQFIIDVRGGSKEKPYLQEWFAIIFAIVAGWYEAKYGAALKTKSGILLGVVQIHNLPFKVRVPPTYAAPHASGELSDLCFGPSLGERETPLKWIDSPPALESLTTRQSNRLDRDLRSLTKLLRSTNLNFMLGDPAPEQYKQFRAVTLGSIRKAAEHIVSGGEGDYASAAWEIHYAVENAVKALIAQAGAQPDLEHGLSHLVKQAQSVGVMLNGTKNIEFLPSARTAIKYRYGKPLPGGYRAAFAMYQKALPLLADFSSTVKRSLVLGDGATITLRKPPWFQFLEDE